MNKTEWSIHTLGIRDELEQALKPANQNIPKAKKIIEEFKKTRLKQIYRKLAKKHHPDHGGDAKKFREIQEAYEYALKFDVGPPPRPARVIRFYSGNMSSTSTTTSGFWRTNPFHN